MKTFLLGFFAATLISSIALNIYFINNGALQQQRMEVLLEQHP